MFCPNCGATYEDNSHFCGKCGTELIRPSSTGKGSHWVPILILVLLSAVGIGLFFATRDLVPDNSGTPWFEIRSGTLSFDESLYDGSPELAVPDSIGSQAVRYLEPGCFADCDSLTTVLLPEGLNSISWCAFDNCDRLRGIFLPEGISIINDYAFADCTELEAICIPASVTYISPTAFENCTSLNHVFYSGTYSEWMVLYGQYLDNQVNIHCTDGNY